MRQNTAASRMTLGFFLLRFLLYEKYCLNNYGLDLKNCSSSFFALCMWAEKVAELLV